MCLGKQNGLILNVVGMILEGFYRSVGPQLEYLAHHRCLIHVYSLSRQCIHLVGFLSLLSHNWPFPLSRLPHASAPELDPSGCLLNFAAPELSSPRPFAPFREGIIAAFHNDIKI